MRAGSFGLASALSMALCCCEQAAARRPARMLVVHEPYSSTGSGNEARGSTGVQSPTHDPNVAQTDPGTYQRQSPDGTPPAHLDPRYNASINPEFNSVINPRFNPAIDPQYNPSLDPEYNSARNPNYNTAIDPRYNPSIDPKSNPRLNPEFNSSLTSDSVDVAAYYFRLDASFSATLVYAESGYLVVFDKQAQWRGFAILDAEGGMNLFLQDSTWWGYARSNFAGGYNGFAVTGDWVGFIVPVPQP